MAKSRAWTVVLLAALAAAAGCQPRTQEASEIPHTPIPKAPARFAMEAADGRVRYTGTVADDAARADALSSLARDAPGAEGTVTVVPRTRPAAWTGALGQAAAALRGTGGKLVFGERQILLDGELTQEQRATLLRRIQRLYPGYALSGAFQGVDRRQALPDPGDMDGLLAFLSTAPVAFHQGSGLLTPASIDNLGRVARGMKAAGPEARIEIRIHTDGADASGGTPASQREVVQQRTDAVVTQLALRGVSPQRLRAVAAPVTTAAGDGAVDFGPFPPGATSADAALPPDPDDAGGAAGPGRDEARRGAGNADVPMMGGRPGD